MKVGVIGVGSMGANHARVYSEIADLVGVCDAREEVSKEVAGRFKTRAYTSVEEFLRKERPDAVTVATPTTTHYNVAKEVLQSGVHVLIEKPMTSTLREAEELIDLARDMDLTLAVGHIERFNPVVEAARDLLTKEWVGEVISLSTRRVSRFPSRIRDVGAILDLGIHDIDVIYYLTGRRVERVFALGGISKETGFEDHATIVMEISDGLDATVHVSWLVPMKVRKLSVTTSRSYMEVDYMEQVIEVSTSEFVSVDMGNLYNVPQRYDIRRIHVRREEPLKRELKDFLLAVERRKQPLVPGEDGMAVLKVAKAAEASLKKGGVVVIDEFEEG